MAALGLLVPCALALCLSSASAVEAPEGREAGTDPEDREEAPPRASFREAVRTFFHDGAYLFSFPRRITAEGVAWTSTFAAGTLILIEQDDAIRRQVIESDSEIAGRAACFFEPLGRWYVEAGSLGIAYAVGRGAGSPGASATAARAFEAWLWTAVATSGAKAVFGRDRPGDQADAHGFFEGDTIFPSGHTARSFAIASVLADRHGPRAAWIAYPVAALIGLSTVQRDLHWASDVLAGAGLGLAVGHGIAARHRGSGRVSWRLRPVVPGGVGIAIRWTPGSQQGSGRDSTGAPGP